MRSPSVKTADIIDITKKDIIWNKKRKINIILGPHICKLIRIHSSICMRILDAPGSPGGEVRDDSSMSRALNVDHKSIRLCGSSSTPEFIYIYIERLRLF